MPTEKGELVRAKADDMSRASRLPVVGVMGSGVEPHEELASVVGRAIAEAGCHLLTGGGGGVMEAVARAFCAEPERRGLSIGVVRAADASALELRGGRRVWRGRGPNPWVEIPIRTHLPLSGVQGKDPLSRNPINVLSSDLVVVLPGGPGTRTELELAREFGRPVVLFLGKGGEVDGRGAGALMAGGASGLELAEDLTGLRRALGRLQS